MTEGRDESVIVKVRYKPPTSDESRLIKMGLVDRGEETIAKASDDLRFAAAVAGFGMLLRDSPHKGSVTYDAVLTMANSAAGKDKQGYRKEFVELVGTAKKLSK